MTSSSPCQYHFWNVHQKTFFFQIFRKESAKIHKSVGQPHVYVLVSVLIKFKHTMRTSRWSNPYRKKLKKYHGQKSIKPQQIYIFSFQSSYYTDIHKYYTWIILKLSLSVSVMSTGAVKIDYVILFLIYLYYYDKIFLIAWIIKNFIK